MIINGIDFAFGGFNTMVNYRNGEIFKVVTGLRPGGKSYTLNNDFAIKIKSWLEMYVHELASLSIPIPSTHFDIRFFLINNQSQNKGVCVWITQKYIGDDFAKLLKSLTREQVRKTVRQIRECFIERFDTPLNFKRNGFYRVGADLKTDNFCLDKNGTVFLVDIFPPHIWKNEKSVAVVEMFDISQEVYNVGLWKIYKKQGMVVNALSQLGRVRIDLWDVFTQEIEPPLFLKDFDLDSLTGKDVYIMRFLCCEYAFKNKISQHKVESFFKSTHFEDIFSQERLMILKNELYKFKKGDAR